MHRRGQGVSQDYQQAMDWSIKAASAGNAEAQYNIGDLYYHGLGVPEDYEQARNWYLKTNEKLFLALKRKFTLCWFHISKTMINH
jgi:TPR repeat protein